MKTMAAWVLVGAALAGCAAERAGSREPLGAVTSILVERGRAPLDLEVTGRDLGDDRVEITASIRAAGRLAAPPVIRVELPDGATLEAGARNEVLSLPGTDQSTGRTFVVRGTRGAPVTVHVDSTGAAMGAHARASWPRVEPPAPVNPPTVPVPPVNVNGIPVERAVPLE